jgi:hypothetical protein
MGRCIEMMRPVLTEPFAVPDVFITGMEVPFVQPDFARLIFWTDHPPVLGGDDPIIERQIAAKLVMTSVTFHMIRRLLIQQRDGS